MAEYARMENVRIEADKAKEQLDADLGEEQEEVIIEHEVLEENLNDELDGVEEDNSDENVNSDENE